MIDGPAVNRLGGFGSLDSTGDDQCGEVAIGLGGEVEGELAVLCRGGFDGHDEPAIGAIDHEPDVGGPIAEGEGGIFEPSEEPQAPM